MGKTGKTGMPSIKQVEKPPGVLLGEGPYVGIFKGDVAVIWKGGSGQGRFARLARSGKREHRIEIGITSEILFQDTRDHKTNLRSNRKFVNNVK